MPTIPYVRATHSDGQSWSAAKANALEGAANDAHYMPCVRVYHNANQSITTATLTALAFNSERYDQAGNAADTQHDTSTNNSRLTCKYAGVYSIKGCAEFAANATGQRQVRIRLNGSSYIALENDPTSSGTNGTVLAVSADYSLAVNDYVELVVFQDSGGNLNVTATGNYSPEFMMHRVG